MLLSVFFSPISGQQVIKGKVVDNQTNEGLVGVNIYVPDKSTGTTSDNNSEFSFVIEKAVQKIIFSYSGYKTLEVNITANNFMIVKMEQSPIELDQIIITATREQQERKDAPISMSKIQTIEINDLKANFFPQLLERVSSVHVANFDNEQQSLAIRQPLSFARTQIVILEDEIPIGPVALTTSSDLNEVNMTMVKETEIVRGPSSSLYGSEAVGGAVNFILKNPPIIPTVSSRIQVSNWGYKRIDMGLGNTFGKFGFYASGYYAQRREGFREHTDFDKLTISIKSVYQFNNNTKLTALATFSNFNNDFAGSLDSLKFYEAPTFNQHTFSYVHNKTIRGSLRFDKIWNENSKTFFNFYYRYKYEDEIPTYLIKVIAYYPKKKYAGQYINSYYHSGGFIAQHKQKFSFLNSSLISGLNASISPDVFYSEVIDVTNSGDTFTSYKLTGMPVQDFEALLINSAAYINFELSPFTNLKTTFSLRYDRLDYKYDNHLDPSSISGAADTIDMFHHLCPKVGINYMFNKNIGAYSNFSVGFAPPLFSQLYNTVKVPVLKPSTFYSYEVGTWLSFNKKNGYFDLTFYQSDGKNEIVEVYEAGATINKSVGETRHRGIETTLKYKLFASIDIRFAGSYAKHEFINFNEGSNDFSGNEMNLAPRFISNSSITYKPNKGLLKGFRLSADWVKIGSYFLDEQNSEKYDGYDLFNARVGYLFRGFELWMNILNLTDNLYAVRVSKSYYGNPKKPTIVKSYSPGIPRTIEIGIGYNFVSNK